MQDQLLDTQNREALQEQLLEKIEKKEYTVGIIGLGYVGLPLMWTFHEMGMPVMGLDIDEDKVTCIEEGRPYIKHLGEEMMEVLSTSDRCSATTDFSRLKERSEEHTSELQSRGHLVCRLLL